MPEPTSPTDIALETLRQLAARRLPPNPENYRSVYQQIAGHEELAPFPDKALQHLARQLPRATPAQLRSSRRFEAAVAENNWEGFARQIVTLINEASPPELSWSSLLKELLQQFERRQNGLNSVTKLEAIQHVLDASADPERLHARLTGLLRGWAQLPSAQTLYTDTQLAAFASEEAAEVELAQAPTAWRRTLADTLESALGVIFIDTPEIADEARALASALRQPDTRATKDFDARLKEFAYRVQWIVQDQGEIREGLMGLLHLLIENIAELGIQDSYLQGQLRTLLAVLDKPLDKHALAEFSERLREVIYKQGTIRHSLDAAQLHMQEMLGGFVSQLDALATHSGSACERFNALRARLESGPSANELAPLVADILGEARAFEAHTRDSRDRMQQLSQTVEHANREIARLESELKAVSEQIRHDTLTGALNRKGLDESFERELARTRRRGLPLSIAMLDIDNFKQLNDSLGHATGDDALRHLTRIVRENLRPQDAVGRFGGEEFLVLMPETGLEDARLILARLQRELTRRFFLHDNQRVLITFSAGLAEVRDDETPAQVFRRADLAMYEAKRRGKNRVEIAP